MALSCSSWPDSLVDYIICQYQTCNLHLLLITNYTLHCNLIITHIHCELTIIHTSRTCSSTSTMPQQQDQSPFWANETAPSEQRHMPDIGGWDVPPLRERLPNFTPEFGFGRRNPAAGSDASSLAEPPRGPTVGDAAPGSQSPIHRYMPVPSLVEGSTLGSGLFCAPGCSSPASPAPLSEEGLQDYDRWHTMTTREILSYGPGLFRAPEVPYSPTPSPGYYSMDYAYGDWSVEFYGHVEACVERIINHGLYGPWPEEFYNVNLANGPEDSGGQIFGRAPTPPLRPREPEPGVPIFRQHEVWTGMPRPCSRWLPTTCEHCGVELQPYKDLEEDPEDFEDLCTCDLHRQMRGEY